LSDIPSPVAGHVAAQSTRDTGVRERFAEQAAADWQGFLDARAAELVPGGRLVMVEPCAHPDGLLGSEPMLELIDEVLAGLVSDGSVSPEDAAAATLPMWMRTPDEYEHPVTGHSELELVTGQLVEGLKSPLWSAFEKDGSAETYARKSVAAMRAWSEAMLRPAIDDPATLDDFYERCTTLGAADPERLHLRVFHVVLDIRRG
jgi:hypothetical protein